MKDRIHFPKNTIIHIGGVTFRLHHETAVLGDARNLPSVNPDCIKDIDAAEPQKDLAWFKQAIRDFFKPCVVYAVNGTSAHKHHVGNDNPGNGENERQNGNDER